MNPLEALMAFLSAGMVTGVKSDLTTPAGLKPADGEKYPDSIMQSNFARAAAGAKPAPKPATPADPLATVRNSPWFQQVTQGAKR